MSVVTRPWSRLSVLGKVLLPLILALVAVLLALLVLWVSGLLPFLIQWVLDALGANVGIVRFLVAATIILVITVPIAFMNIFFEMKSAARVADSIHFGSFSTRPALAMPRIAMPFHAVSTLSSLPGGTRLLRAANSFALALASNASASSRAIARRSMTACHASLRCRFHLPSKFAGVSRPYSVSTTRYSSAVSRRLISSRRQT